MSEREFAALANVLQDIHAVSLVDEILRLVEESARSTPSLTCFCHQGITVVWDGVLAFGSVARRTAIWLTSDLDFTVQWKIETNSFAIDEQWLNFMASLIIDSYERTIEIVRQVPGLHVQQVSPLRDDRSGKAWPLLKCSFERCKHAVDFVVGFSNLSSAQAAEFPAALLGTRIPMKIGLNRELHQLHCNRPEVVLEAARVLKFWASVVKGYTQAASSVCKCSVPLGIEGCWLEALAFAVYYRDGGGLHSIVLSVLESLASLSSLTVDVEVHIGWSSAQLSEVSGNGRLRVFEPFFPDVDMVNFYGKGDVESEGWAALFVAKAARETRRLLEDGLSFRDCLRGFLHHALSRRGLQLPTWKAELASGAFDSRLNGCYRAKLMHGMDWPLLHACFVEYCLHQHGSQDPASIRALAQIIEDIEQPKRSWTYQLLLMTISAPFVAFILMRSLCKICWLCIKCMLWGTSSCEEEEVVPEIPFLYRFSTNIRDAVAEAAVEIRRTQHRSGFRVSG